MTSLQHILPRLIVLRTARNLRFLGSSSSNELVPWRRSRCLAFINGNGGGGYNNRKMIRCASFYNDYDMIRCYSSNYGTDKINEVKCEKCSEVYNWSGGKGIEFVKAVACPKCGALQKIRQLELPNYFDILEQSKSYRVDVQEMSNRAKRLQKRFHPDLFSQRGDDQQELSQEYSSLINKALSTLSDPISRGRYMLTLSGLSPDDPNTDIERSMTKDPEFLEEVMELNWRLEEIQSEKEWKEFRAQNVETMKEIHLELEKAFEKDDIKEAQRLLGRLKYFDTLQHKLKELQSRIGIVE